jgi:hypothetical protein
MNEIGILTIILGGEGVVKGERSEMNRRKKRR